MIIQKVFWYLLKTGRWIGGADPDWEGAAAGEKK